VAFFVSGGLGKGSTRSTYLRAPRHPAFRRNIDQIRSIGLMPPLCPKADAYFKR
jgi:hypothetical protein